jgi:hypothetical protein
MKIKIALILLGVNLAYCSAYAAHLDETPMPVSNDVNVTAPDQSGMWSFGTTAVLMQPTNPAFTYVDLESSGGPPNNLAGADYTDNFQDVNQGYHWWFGADITYAFPGNGRDVTLAYEGLHGDDTNNIAESPAESANNTLYPVAFSLYYATAGIDFNTAKGESKTTYDAGDLIFGQKLDVGERIRLHPFVGLRYAYIDVKNIGTYLGSDNGVGTPNNIMVQDTWESTFSGIGPRLGSDAQVKLSQGFSVRARLGLSALIGSSSPKYEDRFTDTDNTPSSTNIYPTTHDSTTRVVPEIDGRLGLNYTYNFNSKVALGVEAGWQATEYINGISMIAPPQDQSVVYGVKNDPSNSALVNSNFGLQGPYARLQLDIA